MDFDIDAVLDQLEKTINQSDTEEKETTSTANATPRKSVDELLLLDLDPLAPTGNDELDQEEKLQRLKQDIQELYASSAIIHPPSVPTPTLPDVISQPEDSSTVTLPAAVEQLELEVRQEILQHTLDLPLLLPDLTTIVNGNHHEHEDESIQSTSSSSLEEEEEQSPSSPIVEHTDQSNVTPLPSEPDLLQHETPIVLHSVDSIVNAPAAFDLHHTIPTAVPMIDIEPMQLSSSELVFTACAADDDDGNTEEPILAVTEELVIENLSSSMVTSITPSQDFDLVKNILSEIFDKPDEEELVSPELVNADEAPAPMIGSSDEDFRFLDEMLATIDVSDADIHQLTPAEVDRVDSLLKQIVDAQQSEMTPVTEEEEEPPPVEQVPNDASLPVAAVPPVDEELVRVEQEWSQLTEDEKRLGSIAPEWVNDDQAPACMRCAAKFSLTRRRHHCRACGKVFCAGCCSQKVKLIHDDNREDRACNDCVHTINHVDYLWTYMRNNQKPRSSVLRKKTVSDSSTASANVTSRPGVEHKKSVTFDDGFKPGVEAAALAAAAATNIMASNKARTNAAEAEQLSSAFKRESFTKEELEERIQQLKDPQGPPVEFSIHKNLRVISKIVDSENCCLSPRGHAAWIFSTRGLSAVAQDELVFIFDEEDVTKPEELITDLLLHIQQIYLDATKGSFVRHLGLSLTSSVASASNAAGFLYFTDASSTHELFPEAPILFGILVHREELPTAQCFPVRLLLRLGFEFQSYPWPLFSIIQRETMFNDTQQTIMSLLCDFRSYTYTLPTIRGLVLSIGNQGSVSIRIPQNRHDDMLKSLEQSSPHALSFGIVNIQRQVHSKHLVTVQNPLDQQYETRLFSSPSSNSEQIMIGGSFLVVNASLRSRDSPSSSPLDGQGSGSFSSNTNLNAKVNTIEDGVMLQLDGDTLKILKQCLRERKDYAILAKARSLPFDEPKEVNDGHVVKRNSSEQLVEFLWVDDENDANRGVRSPIDHFPMDGIRNSRIHYAGQRSPLLRLRWTDLFFVECHFNAMESFDPTRLADSLAKAFTQALTPFVDMLVEGKYRKLALRVTVDRENASYIAGSNGEQLSAFFLSQLDDHMIPIIMKASDSVSRTAPSLVLELVFYLLD